VSDGVTAKDAEEMTPDKQPAGDDGWKPLKDWLLWLCWKVTRCHYLSSGLARHYSISW